MIRIITITTIILNSFFNYNIIFAIVVAVFNCNCNLY